MARRVLTEQYEVEVFADGPPVIERLAGGERPDVLVLDWHMPQMSGLEVCRFLRERFDEASLPILILTATGGQDDLLDGLAAGANDFVTKAFDPAELLARVGTLARARVLFDSLKKTELATRRAREAADEANRAKDVFLATVSHELRTPLNSILGWARLLSEGTLDRETLARGLATIQRNAQIQVQLIEDILDTTRAISGKLHLELTTFDLAQVARATFDAAKPSADAKHLDLHLVVPEEPLRVRGDIDRLQQAVGNLLANAVKFTPSGGKVTLRARRLENAVEIAVVDTGVGIAADQQALVFEEFRQAGGDYLRKSEGTGLGLSLAKRFVELHGGTIRVESAPGRGSTFAFILPERVLEAV